MLSRERLLSLGAVVAEWATTKRVRIVAQVLLLAAIVFVALRVRSLWHGSHIQLAGVNWAALAGAFFIAAAGVLASAFIWLVILNSLDARTRARWATIFLQAQLAKYIPGTLWQYAGRLTLARSRGLPMRAVAVSMPIELAASVGGAATVSAFLLGLWGIPVVLAVGAGCIVVARRTGGSAPRLKPEISSSAFVLPLYALIWVAIGSAFWLTARAFLAVPLQQLPFYVGAFAAAWIVGVVAIYAPGGLGVREGMLIALLSSRLGSADALVIAAASRGLLTLIDLVLAVSGFVILRRDTQRQTGSENPGAAAIDPSESAAPWALTVDE